MKQKFTRTEIGIVLVMLVAGMSRMNAQSVLYEENMGVPTANTIIGNYSGWQNNTVTYIGDGTCDVRASSASTGYGGASGGGNVMINDTEKWFQISGLNTNAAHPTVKLYCGLRKTTAENGSNFVVEFSTDSIVWVRLPMADTLPTGTGTSGWHRVCFPDVPAHNHLHLRFSNLSNVDYRLDDIRIVDGDEVVLETVETPVCTPPGGTFYESQQIILECATDGASIHYTTDGSIPDSLSPVFSGSLDIGATCMLKAIATHENMYNSQVLTVQFTILDTNATVALPFDISGNSDSTHTDIKTMPGFRSNRLGTSYANGSAKFESKNAGTAWLTAHLDSSPGSLSFDLRGVKGGSPSSYSGITFLVSESADGTQWSTLTVLNESDISTEEFSHFADLPLSPGTRYVRWLLASAASGNTQLNNIVITKHLESGEGEGGGIHDPEDIEPNPYPNPASTQFRWSLCEDAIHLQLFSENGALVRQWNNVQSDEVLDITGISPGYYVLKAATQRGSITKSLIIK